MALGTETSWAPVGRDGTYHYSAMALSVFWPVPGHSELIARWPRLTDEVGATWDEHRWQVERRCAPRDPGRPRALGIEGPDTELLDPPPEWDAILNR